MQLLIDSTTENPAVLRLAAALLIQLAQLEEPQAEIPAASINGPQPPIVLTAPEIPPAGLFPVPPPPSSTIPPVSVTASLAPQTVPVAALPVTPLTAPVAETSAASEPTGKAVAVDKNGFPWDQRIHSSSQKLNADGSWRLRKNLAPGVLEQVTAELKGAPVGVPAGTAAVPIPPPPVPVTATAPNVPVPLPPAATPGGAPAVLPGDGSDPVDFRTLMQRITPLLQGGKLTHQTVGEVCKAHGLEGLQGLIPQPILIPAIWQAIRGIVGE